MKNDWFSVLDGFINVPFDENLAYEFEIFFRDFVFIKNEDNHIILKCLKNDKDYYLKKADNSILLKYNYEEENVKYFIKEKLNIYNRVNDKLVHNKLINSNSICYKSNINLKKEYNNTYLAEILNRKASYYGEVNNIYTKRYDNTFVDTNNYDMAFKSTVNYDKTLIRNDIKTKHLCPDTIIGATCVRDNKNTYLKTNKVIQGFNLDAELLSASDTYPVSILADTVAQDYFINENKKIKVNDYTKKKKRKIGF